MYPCVNTFNIFVLFDQQIVIIILTFFRESKKKQHFIDTQQYMNNIID